ncbi:MAG: PD40 domain-containing protein [Acidobacteriaceae bacterium]|nr:PD40 domain-containing protein [Acidobacteriaceae bacterium]MBV9307424.1 PD40 domain-containing protein [Acidobacteriaceae bacterium]MBV9937006.1 PD40 domain-containing protein [Acidobacteriaceae bacterium]
MPLLKQQRPAFRFGVFELNPNTRELRKNGVKLKLQEQPLQILLLLLERPGEVVTRDEIHRRLWPENTYVDFDNAINSAVRKIRDALGDAADNPRFIETVARQGYRFIAPVIAPAPVPPLRSPGDDRRQRRFPMDRWRWALVAGVLVLVIGAWILYKETHFQQGRAAGDVLPPPVPLTSYPGFQWSPSFSPDGTRVAFTWEEPGRRPPSICVKLIGSSDPVRLTDGKESDFAPAWSPDGRWIAFLRAKGQFSCAVMLIPSVGGAARELARVQMNTAEFFSFGRGSTSPPFLAWSSDSKWLLALEQSGVAGLAPERRNRIVRIAVDSGEKSPFLLSLDADKKRSQEIAALTSGEGALAVSPDGKKLAFIHTLDEPDTDIYVVGLTDEMLAAGPARSLHFGNSSCHGIAWDTDGRSVIVSSNRRGSVELWRVPVDGSVEPSRIDVSDELPLSLAVSRTGQRLAYTHFYDDWNLWRVDLTGGRLKDAAAFITSSKDEYHADYSPDGRRIAFESNRFGNHQEIWISDAEASHADQLTSGDAWAGSPRWSPDGQRIAFDGNATGHWEIYVIHSDGGKPIRLTSGSGSKIRPTWSHDGKWIYYCASGQSGPQIWKKLANGGPEIALTKSGGCNQMESPDAEYVYYLNKGNTALWRVPVSGGTEAELLQLGPDAQFALGKRGVYFLDSRHANTLKFMDYRSGSIKVVGNLPGPMIHGMTVSPDNHWLLYGRSDSAGSQLRLVDRFH